MSLYPRQILSFLCLCLVVMAGTHFAYNYYNARWITYREGENYYEQKEWEKAVGAYQESVAQGLENPVVWLRLGHSYSELKEYPRALLYYKKYMNIRPKELWVKKVYAGLLTANGDFEEAQKYYQEILNQDKEGHEKTR